MSGFDNFWRGAIRAGTAVRAVYDKVSEAQYRKAELALVEYENEFLTDLQTNPKYGELASSWDPTNPDQTDYYTSLWETEGQKKLDEVLKSVTTSQARQAVQQRYQQMSVNQKARTAELAYNHLRTYSRGMTANTIHEIQNLPIAASDRMEKIRDVVEGGMYEPWEKETLLLKAGTEIGLSSVHAEAERIRSEQGLEAAEQFLRSTDTSFTYPGTDIEVSFGPEQIEALVSRVRNQDEIERARRERVQREEDQQLYRYYIDEAMKRDGKPDEILELRRELMSNSFNDGETTRFMYDYLTRGAQPGTGSGKPIYDTDPEAAKDFFNLQLVVKDDTISPWEKRSRVIETFQKWGHYDHKDLGTFMNSIDDYPAILREGVDLIEANTSKTKNDKKLLTEAQAVSAIGLLNQWYREGGQHTEEEVREFVRTRILDPYIGEKLSAYNAIERDGRRISKTEELGFAFREGKIGEDYEEVLRVRGLSGLPTQAELRDVLLRAAAPRFRLDFGKEAQTPAWDDGLQAVVVRSGNQTLALIPVDEQMRTRLDNQGEKNLPEVNEYAWFTVNESTGRLEKFVKTVGTTTPEEADKQRQAETDRRTKEVLAAPEKAKPVIDQMVTAIKAQNLDTPEQIRAYVEQIAPRIGLTPEAILELLRRRGIKVDPPLQASDFSGFTTVAPEGMRRGPFR